MRKRATTQDNSYQKLWHKKLNLYDIYRKNSYIKTLLAIIKESFLFDFFIKSLSFFRKFRLISYIALGFSYIVTLIGTGAILLIYISVFSVIVFFSLFFLLNFVIIARARRKKANEFFEKELNFEKIYIFLITRTQKFYKQSFFSMQAKEFASESSAVLIVSPKIIDRTGFDGEKRKSFITFRKEAENIYLLRSHYYFSFKKKILPKIKDKAILIF